jgi:hypothetical protein
MEGGEDRETTATVYFSENKALMDQFAIFMEALTIYDQRNAQYKDNWRRMGWRGCLVRVRERAERLWDKLWDAPPRVAGEAVMPYQPHDLDDAIDLINFCGFLIRSVREGDRDGTWW